MWTVCYSVLVKSWAFVLPNYFKCVHSYCFHANTCTRWKFIFILQQRRRPIRATIASTNFVKTADECTPKFWHPGRVDQGVNRAGGKCDFEARKLIDVNPAFLHAGEWKRRWRTWTKPVSIRRWRRRTRGRVLSRTWSRASSSSHLRWFPGRVPERLFDVDDHGRWRRCESTSRTSCRMEPRCRRRWDSDGTPFSGWRGGRTRLHWRCRRCSTHMWWSLAISRRTRHWL